MGPLEPKEFLEHEGLEVTVHHGPVHVLLCPLLDPGEISPVIHVEDLLDLISQGLGDHQPGLQVAVIVVCPSRGRWQVSAQEWKCKAGSSGPSCQYVTMFIIYVK